jgi:hypothetical protein
MPCSVGYYGCVRMTYAELHELVDRLTQDQADAVGAVVRQLLAGPTNASAAEGGAGAGRLSFAGVLHSGRGDLAARSEEIIREELGRPA